MAPEPLDPLDDDEPLARRRPPPPRTWRDRLEQVADATGSTPARMVGGAVAVLVVVGVALWALRPPPAPVEAALPRAEPVTTASTAPPSSEVEVVVVDVAGAVARPGVHELAAGARVVDALDAAGGLTAAADAARINLAAPLRDGERVYVPAVGEEPPLVVVGDPPAAGTGDGASGPVDLNTADVAALEALPGIGPATAAAIVQHRAEVGTFSSVDQLLDVPGIGEAKLAALRDLVTV